jgi:hypothetical protein
MGTRSNAALTVCYVVLVVLVDSLHPRLESLVTGQTTFRGTFYAALVDPPRSPKLYERLHAGRRTLLHDHEPLPGLASRNREVLVHAHVGVQRGRLQANLRLQDLVKFLPGHGGGVDRALVVVVGVFAICAPATALQKRQSLRQGGVTCNERAHMTKFKVLARGCWWNSDVFWGIVKKIATEAQVGCLPFCMFVYQARCTDRAGLLTGHEVRDARRFLVVARACRLSCSAGAALVCTPC